MHAFKHKINFAWPCVLSHKSLCQTLPKNHCDQFMLSFKSHIYSAEWAKQRFINVLFHCTKPMVDISEV